MRPTTNEDRSFEDAVEPHRAALHAHCYRMLGSLCDADDALQETLFRAWRGAGGLRSDGAVRSWLYTIATNVCLTEVTRRRRRVLPADYASPAERHTPPGGPVGESTWLEPYPDELLGLPAGPATPEACYEQQEAIELAFVAAVQHLLPTQRAVLLLREVMGFSAQEVASMLATSVPTVTSALQRARVAVRERVPAETQQASLAALGDIRLRDLVGQYVEAWERCDVDAFVSLLAEDATFTMPPLSTWYTPRDVIAAWARESSLSGAWRWRTLVTRANAQPALGFYAWDGPSGAYVPFALNVLSVHGRAVSAVTAFTVRSIHAAEPEAYIRFPEQPINARQAATAFGRFGLPDRLNAN